jgi:hypothetical protein
VEVCGGESCPVRKIPFQEKKERLATAHLPSNESFQQLGIMATSWTIDSRNPSDGQFVCYSWFFDTGSETPRLLGGCVVPEGLVSQCETKPHLAGETVTVHRICCGCQNRTGGRVCGQFRESRNVLVQLTWFIFS